MNENKIEQITNGERISQINAIIESLGPGLSNTDVEFLKKINERIAIIVKGAASESQGLAINKTDTVKRGLAIIPESGIEKKKDERAKILLLTAVDSFLKYARQNEDVFKNGWLEDRRMKGISFLTAAGGVYASSYTKPSERGFSGDLRMVEKRMNKERVMADDVEKEKVLEVAGTIMPGVVTKIKLLLDEYDSWGSIYRERAREADFNPSDSFLGMTHKVCEAMEKIRSELG